MICPICRERNLKSKVYIGSSKLNTIMGSAYYDEEGIYHFHGNSATTTNYNCSNRHSFSVTTKMACPAYPNKCDHAGEEYTSSMMY